jgi:hypothetical protein
MKNSFLPVAVICSVVFFVFTGCTAAVELHAADDGSITVKYAAGLGTAFMDMITAVSGTADAAPVFDADAITAQFIEAGLGGTSASVPARNRLELTTVLPVAGTDLFTQTGTVLYSNNKGKKRQLVLALSPEHLRQVYALLPQSAKSYIDLFMAPVFTGETMSKRDYLELLSSLYGKPLADEIEGASLSLSLFGFPGRSPQKVVKIPLTDLLLLEKPVSYSVAW